MGQKAMSFSRDLVVVLLPMSVTGFVLGYTYLAGSTGSIFFRFLIGTLPGNLVLATVQIFTAYHFMMVSLHLVSRYTGTWQPAAIEYLHVFLPVLSLSVLFYPLLSIVLSTLEVSNTAGLAFLSFIVSLIILLPLLYSVSRFSMVMSLLLCLAMATIALLLPKHVLEAYDDLAKAVSYLERLVRELGIAR